MTLMTEPATSLPVMGAADLLARTREERATRDAAELRILLLAIEWAERHVVAPPTPAPEPECHLEEQPHYGRSVDEVIAEREQWGLPELAWHTGASFAAALGLSTASGDKLIRDALVLSLRLPRTFARVVAGEVPVWRARRIADAAVGQHRDVVAYLDAHAAPVAEKVGTLGLDRIIDAAMLALHPEEREIKQLEDLDARFVKLFEDSINHSGIAEMAIRADWADVSAFNDTVAEIAALLGREDVEAGAHAHESLDVRRSIAVGILADPARALTLLNGADATPTRARIMRFVAHLSEDNIAGLSPVATDADGRAFLTDIFTRWAHSQGTRVHIQPLLHCGGCPDCSHDTAHTDLDVYRPSAADIAIVENRDRQCMFPYCARPSRRCDHDHRIPFDAGGPTCPCNLTPLCRHHHRLKTHAGWAYTAIEPGVYLWTDRYGQQFLRTRDGTSDLNRE